MFDSTSHAYQPSHINTHEQLVHTRLVHTKVDLLEMGAWTYLREGPQCYLDAQCHASDSNKPSPCPYHTAVVEFYYNATGAEYELAPLERWLNEGVGDEGSMTLQLRQRLVMECTCIIAHEDLEQSKEKYN